MHPDRVLIRPLSHDDLEAVLRVQAECYGPAMQEPAAVIRARLAAAGDTAFAAVAGGALLGYLFAYRSLLGSVTPLGAAYAPAGAPDTLYLHDLAVSPRAAGQGLARRLAQHAAQLARREALPWCALVSVQDSQRFWEKLGYRAAACPAPQAAQALASYPALALYMTRPAHP
ncbi:GNAT family N-acetyltransferase [Massilia sp. GCM10023247]|uniref:GNAT family N-acetyltransferase n=1 Tax=Massilia sp. GCM10023247 TaxID=3252643 RepID=UPI00360A2FF5